MTMPGSGEEVPSESSSHSAMLTNERLIGRTMIPNESEKIG
jgi:hypothetical protein